MVKQKQDKLIMFCNKCNWKIINPDDNDKTNRCPKCNSWTWEASQNYYYQNGKEVGRDFNLTDNDESFFQSYDIKDAKRITTKAFKLMDSQSKPKT